MPFIPARYGVYFFGSHVSVCATPPGSQMWMMASAVGVNLTGAFRVLRAAYSYFLREKKKGKMIVIGSIADHVALECGDRPVPLRYRQFLR